MYNIRYTYHLFEGAINNIYVFRALLEILLYSRTEVLIDRIDIFFLSK